MREVAQSHETKPSQSRAQAAHEVNNPLDAVTNLIYLARGSESFEEAREYLATADLELRRASGITNQTLRFHKQSSKPTECTGKDLLNGVITIHQGRLTNCSVRVEKRFRSSHPVLCFEGEIGQILNNLAGNATDAMQGSPARLLVRSRDGHDWKTGRPGLVMTIADTGTGMSPQTKKKALEAFYTTKGLGGTGLGFWVSRRLLNGTRGLLG